jgi:valyl-tRNA synthetase
MAQLNKSYDPSQVEDRIYKFWLDGNYFHAEVDHNKKAYSIFINSCMNSWSRSRP